MPAIPYSQQSGQGSATAWPLKLISPSGDSDIPTTNKKELQFVPSWTHHASWNAPLALVTNGIALIQTVPAGAGTFNAVLAGSLAVAGTAVLDFARNVVITITHASAVLAVTGLISGLDQYGKVITETWAVTAGGTTKTYTGAKAFASVTGISIIAPVDSSSDSIIAGTGNLLGLPFNCSSPTIDGEMMDGALPTLGTLKIGTGLAAATDYRGTYSPNAAPNGTHIYDVWYIVDNPTDIGT